MQDLTLTDHTVTDLRIAADIGVGDVEPSNYAAIMGVQSAPDGSTSNDGYRCYFYSYFQKIISDLILTNFCRFKTSLTPDFTLQVITIRMF